MEFFPLLDRDKPDSSWWGDPRVTDYVNPGHFQLLKECDPDEISCNVFGHVCPVFAMAEGFTETLQNRQTGRKVPREIMLKVVRRDNYRCQVCGQHVPDNELEIDHLIPHSKGGPTTPDNLRLLCRACNRKKSNSLREILDDFALPGRSSEQSRKR